MPSYAKVFEDDEHELLDSSITISEGSDEPTRPILIKRTHRESRLSNQSEQEPKLAPPLVPGFTHVIKLKGAA